MKTVQMVSWSCNDHFGDRGFVVRGYGRDCQGTQTCLEIEGYKPHLLLFVGNTPFFTFRTVALMINDMKKRGKREFEKCEASFVMMKKLYGYSSLRSEKFLKLSFTSLWARNQATRTFDGLSEGDQWKLQAYDCDLPPVLSMLHERSILPCGWVAFEEDDCSSVQEERGCITHVVDYRQLRHHEENVIVPLRILSFDIECLSHVSYMTGDSIFPDVNNPMDTVSQIGISLWIFGTDASQVHERVLVLDDDLKWFGTQETYCHSVDSSIHSDGGHLESKEQDGPGTVRNIMIQPYGNERELLLGFARTVSELGADLLVGYNIFGFDWEYIYKRCKMHNIVPEFVNEISRNNLDPRDLKRCDSFFISKNLSTSAYGDNQFKLINVPGRIPLDLFVMVKKEHKLDSYKLDEVAFRFIGERKHDLKPSELFKALMQSKESCLRAAEYCVQDATLVIRLIKRLSTIPNLVEMSNITRVCADMVILRGQQIKVYSLVCEQAMRHGYAIVHGRKKADGDEDNQQQYSGATVLEPMRGKYMEDFVTVLDFASLYPSLVIAYNLCYSTLLSDHRRMPSDDDDHNIEGIRVDQERTHFFVREKVRKGLLPQILTTLWERRKEVKKAMKECDKNEEERIAVLNGRQLAIKISMNSLYGFTGALVGYLPCVPIAESITALGRMHIETARSKVLELYPSCQVLYGDSDSIYVMFGKQRNDEGNRGDQLSKVFEISKEAERSLNDFFRKPVEIEFEKVYGPFILLSKKRYMAMAYEKPVLSNAHVEYKGVSIIRRDFCRFTRTTLDEAMRYVLGERDIRGAYEYISNMTRELLMGHVDADELVMSKSLGAKYSKPDATNPMPHVAVAVKMKKRDPNNYPKSGERVRFIFTVNGERLLKDRAEDPEYVKENGLDIDYLYYIDNQMLKPAKEIFDMLLAPEKFDPYRYVKKNIFNLQKFRSAVERKTNNRKRGQMEITSFFCNSKK